MPGRELELILTHEHTDFDALASLLGAALLFPTATPVLPRLMNRNVREFVTLYKSYLPFVAPEDLPRGRIVKAIVVDTRALNAPRAMAPNAEVLVIDHHSAAPDETYAGKRSRRPTPPEWQIVSDAVGANTTLLVERIVEMRIAPTPLQATLLALGIHEDTGSLTYGATTHRDALCLGWLLEPERGVNMDVVNQFLHHPLSAQQRALLQELIDHSEFLQVEGHQVVIAQAEAPGFTDEISTVAARLRDFHEPDAAFLIIDLGDVVQVVARSTTDEIDVGAVMRALGGGGHARAAAAPLRGLTAAALHDRIVALVEEHARSAVTVRNIMSAGRPQTLTPEMTIDAAAELMRRYGHEGFPVLAGGEGEVAADEVLGVLTRREADRAIAHGLGGEPVRRFMRAGKITVRPDDSLSLLRRSMIDSGWGQIPVVDEHGRILGIVTRTDLIKTWDDSSAPEQRADEMARRLASSLSPVRRHLLKLVGEQVDCMGYTVYVVGGFVRDLLLENPSARFLALDVDIVIEGDAIAFARRMEELYGGRVVPHRQFGTAKWLLDDPAFSAKLGDLPAGMGGSDSSDSSGGGGSSKPGADGLPPHLDFVTARTEFYTAPTALPTVESSSIKLDLHRRDFTINTLALCLNPDRWAELLDFYGGLNDLRQGIVRVLHSLSFVDDPTRTLRAVRYEQRFGFTIEARTLELMLDALGLLDRVTPARIRHELERILQEPEPEKILVRLEELGVLAQLHPQLAAGDWLPYEYRRLRAHLAADGADAHLLAQPIARLYWGLLVYPMPAAADEELTQRLGLRHETQRMVRNLHRLREHFEELRRPDLRPSAATLIFDEVEPVALALFAFICDDAQVSGAVRRYLDEWRHIHAELDGHDLKALGVPRGPVYREILGALRAGRLDGAIRTRADEVALVGRLYTGS